MSSVFLHPCENNIDIVKLLVYKGAMMKLNTKKIASELKRLGWNQKRFAAEMGVTRQSIHYYMNRDGGNSFGTIEKIAKVLKINPRDLIK